MFKPKLIPDVKSGQLAAEIKGKIGKKDVVSLEELTKLINIEVDSMPIVSMAREIQWKLMSTEQWRRFLLLVHQYKVYGPFSRHRNITPVLELNKELEYSFDSCLPGISMKNFIALMANLKGDRTLMDNFKEWSRKEKQDKAAERSEIKELTSNFGVAPLAKNIDKKGDSEPKFTDEFMNLQSDFYKQNAYGSTVSKFYAYRKTLDQTYNEKLLDLAFINEEFKFHTFNEAIFESKNFKGKFFHTGDTNCCPFLIYRDGEGYQLPNYGDVKVCNENLEMLQQLKLWEVTLFYCEHSKIEFENHFFCFEEDDFDWLSQFLKKLMSCAEPQPDQEKLLSETNLKIWDVEISEEITEKLISVKPTESKSSLTSYFETYGPKSEPVKSDKSEDLKN